MKKALILLTSIFLSGIMGTNAQIRGMRDVLIGPVAGGGTSWVSNMPGSYNLMPSAYAGVNVIAFSSEYVAWGGQLLASAEGYSINDNGNKETVIPVYLRLPLQAYYFFGDRYSHIRPDLHLGPSFGWKMSESSTTTVTNNEAKPAAPLPFNNFDFGIIGGVGMNTSISPRTSFNIDISYYTGLMEAVENDATGHEKPNNNLGINASILTRINK